jgi:cyclic pyranopterin monophosphate synthase
MARNPERSEDPGSGTGEHPETAARMVDVTAKAASVRSAVAIGTVEMSPGTRDEVLGRRMTKGDVLEVARVAGIMAAKKTADLIPLCHPISLGAIEVQLEGADQGITITARVRTTERTGVEMEALTAVSVAALTVYDMVKGVERGATITNVRLIEKQGGRSGTWRA